MTSIGERAFEWCYGLESIKVESGNKFYDSRNNCNAIIETASNTLVQGCNNTFIPESVTSIGVGAFKGCYSLVSIIIPEGVTRIGNGAFDGCSGFESIKVENGNKFYDSRGNCNAIIVTESNELLWGCNNTFIPESVTGIGDNAFNSCFGLTSIKIPESVALIGKAAFSGCSGLESIIVESGNKFYDSRNNCNAIIETASNTLIQGCNNTFIPESVTSIGCEAFNGCSGLTSITIPKNVTSIGEEAFYDCEGLTSVYCKSVVPPVIQSQSWYTTFYYSVYSSSTLYVPAGSIGAYKADEFWGMFRNIVGKSDRPSFNITSETENEVEVIQLSAGEYWGDIVIPEQIVYNDKTYTVTGIADDAFSGCAEITSVVIGSKETTNENDVTNNPSAVKTRAVGADGFTVGARAFNGCTNLQSVTLGEVVTSIGQNAFAGCTSLASVACESANPPAASTNTFGWYTYKNAVLTVPEAFSAVYQTTAPWSRFAKVTTGIGNVTVDNDAQPRKIFQNGRLIIRKNGKSYNLQGVEIK